MPGSALDGQADSPTRPFTCVLPVVQHSTSARLAQATTSILSCHQGSRVDRHPQHPLREGLTLVASLAWPQLALCGVCTHKSKLEVPVSRNQSFALESERSIADLQILITCRTFHELAIAVSRIYKFSLPTALTTNTLVFESSQLCIRRPNKRPTLLPLLAFWSSARGQRLEGGE